MVVKGLAVCYHNAVSMRHVSILFGITAQSGYRRSKGRFIHIQDESAAFDLNVIENQGFTEDLAR
jgi:hypothetical protein